MYCRFTEGATRHAAPEENHLTRTAEPGDLAALGAGRRELAAAIAEIGFTAVGTVLQVRTVCGTADCACHTDPGKRHGPYWQHTRKVSNKTVTRRLTPAQAALYTEWVSNGRRLRDLLEQMQQLSDQAKDLLLDALPADKHQRLTKPRSTA
jgi:hypothetical protein